jgi:hypothetical protein
MEPTAREIIDALEARYGSSRDTASAMGVHFPVYLMWITNPDSMPEQVRSMLAFRAGLTPGSVGLRARFERGEGCGQVVNGRGAACLNW